MIINHVLLGKAKEGKKKRSFVLKRAVERERERERRNELIRKEFFILIASHSV